MVLPIGVNDGTVEMRSVHAGVTKSLSPQTWFQYDQLGFQAVQDSFVAFGNKVFTKAEQANRALAAEPKSDLTEETIPPLPMTLLSIPELDSETPTTAIELHSGTPPTAAIDTTPPTTALPFDLDNDLHRLLNGSIVSEDPELELEPEPEPRIHQDDFFATFDAAMLTFPTNGIAGPSHFTHIPSILPDGVTANISQDLPPLTPWDNQARSRHTLPPLPPFTPPYPPQLSPDSTWPASSDNTPPPSQSMLSRGAPQEPFRFQFQSRDSRQGLQALPSPPHSTPPPNGRHPSPPLPLDVLLVEDIPPEMKAIYAPALDHADRWGVSWSRCVAALIAFERSRGFSAKSYALPTSKKRPGLFKQWLALRRPASGADWDALGSSDGVAYGAEWWAWWVDLQPTGRRVEGDFLMARRDAGPIAWKRLSKSGPNGMLLVLVGLVWWKMMIGNVDENWCKAVVDVTWAIHEMKNTPDVPKKRKK
ncbi:hypothetical protein FIBSPDRAFT_950221 [Athelia psychrophila]|uniref:Uncharacterized protein n=1 Tax=Athelia psychrophila TaxID=1759441 RepID=A0A166NYQ8_9AGAM|nr:hypothetical protein FIBSPDRAFT_950221 [Fibularhizoctonia sp. CBS 109695]